MGGTTVGSVPPCASRIRGMFQNPTIPFSTQYRTRIVHRLQPKNSTPTSGIRFATTSRIAEREDAVRRYASTARVSVSTVIAGSAEVLVRGQCQELDERVVEDE